MDSMECVQALSIIWIVNLAVIMTVIVFLK